jgi:hypothetical protein
MTEHVLQLSASNSVFFGPPAPKGRAPLLDLSRANPRAIARLKAAGCNFDGCQLAPDPEPAAVPGLSLSAIYASRRAQLIANGLGNGLMAAGRNDNPVPSTIAGGGGLSVSAIYELRRQQCAAAAKGAAQ